MSCNGGEWVRCFGAFGWAAGYHQRDRENPCVDCPEIRACIDVMNMRAGLPAEPTSEQMQPLIRANIIAGVIERGRAKEAMPA